LRDGGSGELYYHTAVDVFRRVGYIHHMGQEFIGRQKTAGTFVIKFLEIPKRRKGEINPPNRVINEVPAIGAM
jgi:hypothetical protein